MVNPLHSGTEDNSDRIGYSGLGEARGLSLEKWKTMSGLAAGKGPCPCVRAPSPECWCADQRSQSGENTVYYCGGHFEECEIYRRLMSGPGDSR
jgi:hypothetical protein